MVGFPDGCACGPYRDLIQATLSAGVRRVLPAAFPAAPPAAGSVAPISTLPVTIHVGFPTWVVRPQAAPVLLRHRRRFGRTA